MQLTQQASMRMEQRQLLTPRMIQSMEILQLPLMALEERIEQEIQNNPVLELREGDGESESGNESPAEGTPDVQQDPGEGEQALVVKENDDAEDFERLAKISDYLENEEFNTNGGSNFRQAARYEGERDRKLDAMNNTAARGITLGEHLLGQWAFVEAPTNIKQAGAAIISYIDAEGYLRTPLDQIQQDAKNPIGLSDLEAALQLVQKLDPPGVGARDV